MRRGRVAGRVERRDFEEHRRDEARQCERARDADGDAGDGEPHAAADDQAEDVAALRADGHAQPDLLRSLADGIGDDSVEADGGEEERDEREEPEQQHRESPLRDRVADGRRERRHREGRERAVDALHGLPHGSRRAPWDRRSCARRPTCR